MVVYVDRLDGFRLHVDVPDAEGEVVAGEDVATILGELDVRHGGDDLGEERLVRRVLLLLVDCGWGVRSVAAQNKLVLLRRFHIRRGVGMRGTHA